MPFSSLSSSLMRRILHGVLIVSGLTVAGGWVYLETHYEIDYIGLVEVIKDELLGRDKTCFDLPEHEWRRIEKCNPERMPASGEDGHA